MPMTFEGEHLIWGELGHLVVIISFVAALMASLAFFLSTQKKSIEDQLSWERIAKIFFFIQAVSTVLIVVILFIIIKSHYFEYNYAWEHTSKQLPTKYLLAAFWEGQEGSFLLWMFWDVVIGCILFFTLTEWRSRVLTIVSVVQTFLGSMLLGIYFFSYKVGSNPFIMLRDAMQDAPIFKRADYLSYITDGNGLNPLLQNYWMVIHPPILFFGFASTVVPFAFAVAALWKKDFTGWINRVLPWVLMSGAVLGTGIMMGGAWAYESLSFGGYWAWDPVENASLVPWILMLAGLHTLLAFKKSGHALRSTFIFFISSFILVLYSTFLTRSGILGNSSVHAFTDLGMSGQLLIYMAALSLPAIVMLIVFWKQIPSNKTEEAADSREFWMFIGSLILLISAAWITLDTSWPVWNKLFSPWLYKTAVTLGADSVQHYNRIQAPFGIIVLLLSSFSLYLKFKKSNVKIFLKEIGVIAAVSIVATCVIGWFAKFNYPTNYGLLLAAVFAFLANGWYIITIAKSKARIYAPALAHLGFTLMILGILISGDKQKVISNNSLGIDFGKDFTEQQKHENMLLYKNIQAQIGDYSVKYIGDSVASPNHYYKVQYTRIDSATGKILEQFVLLPNAQINPKMGLIANPDTRHYWYKDIYTHVTSVPDKSQDNKVDESKFVEHQIKIGDTIFTSSSFAVLQSVSKIDSSDKVKIEDGDLAIAATIQVQTLAGAVYEVKPVFLIHENVGQMIQDNLPELGLTFRLNKIITDQNLIEIAVAEDKPQPDYIIMKAIQFPGINLLWLGTIVMVSGFLLSLYRIWQKRKKEKAISE